MKILNTLDLTGNRINNLADPSQSSDAATKAYVDTVAAGLSWRPPCRAGSTTNITIASPGATIDGVSLSSGDRVLLKNQSTGTQNGIYVWNGASTPMTRATDTIQAGTVVEVNEGSTNGDTAWVVTTDGAITIGTTAITFSAFKVPFGFSTGNGLNYSGGTLTLVLNSSWSGLVVDSSGLRVDSSLVPQKYSANIGNNSSTSIVVTHNLGTKDVVVQLRVVADDSAFITDWVATSTNSITLTFNTAPTANQYRVTVIG